MPTGSDIVRGFLKKSGLFLLRHPGPVGHGVKRDIVICCLEVVGACAGVGGTSLRPESEKSGSGSPERSGEMILFLLSTIHYPLSTIRYPPRSKRACRPASKRKKRSRVY